jgi:adenine-specific DNA-methyltransferase
LILAEPGQLSVVSGIVSGTNLVEAETKGIIVKFEEMNHGELIDLVKKLKEKKNYGLVWEDETTLENLEKVGVRYVPTLNEVLEKRITTDTRLPKNYLIEGDNYFALKVLQYTHAGGIDLIYIDPPYNTGARDWKYNNDYVDAEDTYRHSKWLSFMKNRLSLCRELLSEDGFIACSIDHNELFTLGLLMDTIFGENNRIGIVSVVHKPEGRNQEKFFGTSNEFLIVYAKDKSKANFNKVVIDEELKERFDLNDEKGKYRLKNFIRMTDGKYSLRSSKPHFFYPIYLSADLSSFSLEKKEGYSVATPTTDKGVERTWKTTVETFIKLWNEGEIVPVQESHGIVLYEKLRENQVIKTHWIKKEYHAYHFGTKTLEEILGSKKFNFPKSVHLIADIIKIMTKNDSIILDFFVGSGTTGHSVLQVNREDGGNRKFIGITNNEGQICEEVTFPRLKKVIEGYENNSGVKIDGLGGNLHYFKTNLIEKSSNADEMKMRLSENCVDLLCFKEGVFNQVIKKDSYSIFQDDKKILAIYHSFDNVDLVGMRDDLASFKLHKIKAYIFTFDNSGLDPYEFEDWIDIEIEPLPQKILEVMGGFGE